MEYLEHGIKITFNILLKKYLKKVGGLHLWEGEHFRTEILNLVIFFMIENWMILYTEYNTLEIILKEIFI